MTACVHEGGGRWVGSNKVVELKRKKKTSTLKKLRSWHPVPTLHGK